MSIIPTSTPKANILVVDALKVNLNFLFKTLTEYGYKVRWVIDGSMALKIAELAWPDIILLDTKIPDLDSYELCQQLKSLAITRKIPIIFLTDLEDLANKKKAFAVGGSDYITKPFEIEELTLRIENQLAIKSAQESILQLQLANQKLQEKIDKCQQAEARLLKMAMYNSTTGLTNYNFVNYQLQQILKQTKTQSNHRYIVLLLDCDRSGEIKQSLEYTARKQLNIAIANSLTESLGQSGFVSHFEGQEFIIIIDNIHELETIDELVRKLKEKLTEPFEIEEHLVQLQPHIGIASGDARTQNLENLLDNANSAIQKLCGEQTDLQITRKQPKSVDLIQVNSSFSKLETQLKLAIENQEFIVYYQPIISFKENKLVELEALIRWQHPIRGLISPGEFLPIAEATELIVPIEDLVLQQACQQIKIWQQQDSVVKNLNICLNISSKQFFQPNLIHKITTTLKAIELPGKYLKLDIPENILADNTESALEICQKLKQHHIKLCVDDFGLRDSFPVDFSVFPLDSLTINRSLIGKVANRSQTAEITKLTIASIKQIITLAQDFNVTVTAKGIETTPQEKIIKKLGCDCGQGYLFAPPMDSQKIEEFLLWAI